MLSYEPAYKSDLELLKTLALDSWCIFEAQMSPENWQAMHNTLLDNQTYLDLFELNKANCIVCKDGDQFVGKAYWVPSGHPTDVYQSEWAQLRFISVLPQYAGKGIGTTLTQKCLEAAKRAGENYMALHTSELMGNARHIYAKLGFQQLHSLPPCTGLRYWLYLCKLA